MIRSAENLNRQMGYPDTGDCSGSTASSSQMLQKSMKLPDMDEFRTIWIGAVSTEFAIIEATQAGENAVSYVGEREAESLSDGIKLSALEAATYIDAYPSLATNTYGFPPLYRFLRTAELNGALSRGGNSLLIGSGSTVQEILALYLVPPTDDDVTAFLGKKTTPEVLSEDSQVVSHPDFKGFHLPLLPGKALAIEPDPVFDIERQGALNLLPIPTSKMSMIQATIGDAIAADVIPAELDMILWHRMEPEIFGINEAESLEDVLREIGNVFLPLQKKLSEGGSLCITVGHGVTREEYFQRQELIKLLNKLLPYVGLKPNPEFSSPLTDPVLQTYFGGNFGLHAVILATKQ